MEREYFEIGGRSFYVEPLSWAQMQWLAETAFRGVDVDRLPPEELMTLLQQNGPLILGICFIEQGKTRAQKGEAGLEAARELARWLEVNLSPAEVIGYVRTHFFAHNPPENLWLLAKFQKAAAEPSGSALPNGSSSPSVSSPAETSAIGTGS